jgi:hypothetical protein
VASLPPVSSLFASVLGVNPVAHLLAPSGTLAKLPAASQATLTGRAFFPSLLSGPFHNGLIVVFSVSAALSVLAGLASLLRGKRQLPAASDTVADATVADAAVADPTVAPGLPADEPGVPDDEGGRPDDEGGRPDDEGGLSPEESGRSAGERGASRGSQS